MQLDPDHHSHRYPVLREEASGQLQHIEGFGIRGIHRAGSAGRTWLGIFDDMDNPQIPLNPQVIEGEQHPPHPYRVDPRPLEDEEHTLAGLKLCPAGEPLACSEGSSATSTPISASPILRYALPPESEDRLSVHPRRWAAMVAAARRAKTIRDVDRRVGLIRLTHSEKDSPSIRKRDAVKRPMSTISPP